MSLPEALAKAVKAADEVGAVEIGTPLCKAAGLEATRVVRNAKTDTLLAERNRTLDLP